MLRVILLFTSLIAAGSAFAHSAERPREPVAKHGGVAKRVGKFNIELVLGNEQVQLYVRSQGNRRLATDRASGELLLMHQGQSITLTLAPTGSNQLGASWKAPAVDEFKAVLKLQMFGTDEAKALFLSLPLKPTPESPA